MLAQPARRVLAAASRCAPAVRSFSALASRAGAQSGGRSGASGRSRWLGAAALGSLCAATSAALLCDSSSSAAGADNTGLSSKEFRKLTLKRRVKYNHNTDEFVFALADPSASLNLPVASYLVTRFKGADGKDVIRPYTPISAHEKGELHLLVKEYPAGVMSKHFHSLQPGDQLEIKGPLPKLTYTPNMKRSISMVAGGTGITPMLQIMEEIVRNPNDKTEVHLLFANISSKDILLKERLESLARQHGRTRITYLLDKPEKGWKGPTGYIDADLLRTVLPPPSADHLVLVCGPPGMMKVTSGTKTPDFKQGEVEGALKQLGFDSSNVFKV